MIFATKKNKRHKRLFVILSFGGQDFRILIIHRIDLVNPENCEIL